MFRRSRVLRFIELIQRQIGTPEARTLVPHKIAKYGWIRDLPDPRDTFLAMPSPAVAAQFPTSVDLRGQFPAPYDQGQLGSCTANALAGAIEFQLAKEQVQQVFTPSRLFIYYYERVQRGTVGFDSGASIREGIQAISAQGYPPEPLWPYDPSQFAVVPDAQAQSAATGHKLFQSFCLQQNLDHLRNSLADSEPVVFGMTVFESFESPTVEATGIVPMPSLSEETVGGHAMVIVGYDDAAGMFWVRNSWGESWGIAGYCKIPYAYLTNPQLAADFWTLRTLD
jgi:C1A family cysteine protease